MMAALELYCSKAVNKLPFGKEGREKRDKARLERRRRKDKKTSVCPAGCKRGSDYHFNFPLSARDECWLQVKSLFNYKWKKGAGKEWDKEENRAVAVELVNNESLRRFIKRSLLLLFPPPPCRRLTRGGPVASRGDRRRVGVEAKRKRGRRQNKVELSNLFSVLMKLVKWEM